MNDEGCHHLLKLNFESLCDQLCTAKQMASQHDYMISLSDFWQSTSITLLAILKRENAVGCSTCMEMILAAEPKVQLFGIFYMYIFQVLGERPGLQLRKSNTLMGRAVNSKCIQLLLLQIRNGSKVNNLSEWKGNRHLVSENCFRQTYLLRHSLLLKAKVYMMTMVFSDSIKGWSKSVSESNCSDFPGGVLFRL